MIGRCLPANMAIPRVRHIHGVRLRRARRGIALSQFLSTVEVIVNRPPSNRYEPRLGLFDPSSYPWLLQSVSKTLAHPLHAVMRALRKRTQGNAGPLLRSLIRLKRSKLAGTTFIAVTGSCGKSTTVALADAMLSPAGKCISPSMGKTVRTIDWAWTLVV